MSTGSATIALHGPGPAVVRESFQADYDNDRATAQTVAAMAGHIRACAGDPYIRWCAADAMNTWGRQAAGTPRARAAWACWFWVKSNLSFVQDDEQLLRLLNERDQLELLITPSVMVRLSRRAGDCDDFTMLLCCLLEALGVPWCIQTVACDPFDRARWGHVFAGCPLEDGTVLALDASHGLRPGWSIPRERQYRLQVWGMDGRPEGAERNAQANSIRGLHGYTRGGVRLLRRRRRGVGDDSVDLTGVASAIGADPSLMNQTPVYNNVYNPPPFATPPAPVNNALPGFLASEAGALTRIFGQTIAPQTTIQTPQGLLITGPSGAIAQTGIPALASSGGLNINSLLLVAVIGIGAVVLVKAVGGK